MLEDAMELPRTYEQRLADDSFVYITPPARTMPVRTPPTPTKQLLLPRPPLTVGPKDTTQSSPPRLKRLTPSEMAAKCQHGKCYNCTKMFSREHLKVCPVKGMFLLQLDDVSFSNKDEADDPWISLNANTTSRPRRPSNCLSVRPGQPLMP
jgi:hypothetical protein